MSLFSELKRRNVFRVAVAYIVASWLLLQVTDVLIGILGLPEATGRFVFLALVLGFIPALVVSWVYEMTPEGLRRDTGISTEDSGSAHTGQKLDRITLVMALVAIGLIVADRLIPEQAMAPVTETPAVAAPEEASSPVPVEEAPDRAPSLAVLPFANMSPDPDNEYFADGISEELLNLLAEIQELRIPSRTSSFAFKGQNRDIRDIARQLEVNHVLEGSVRKAGNRVRITAQLIDVGTDTHLWSETYDRELEDIFAIQDEIAGSIVEALKVSLALDVHQPPTDNLEAYTLYLQGRELFRRRSNPENLQEASRMLHQAVEIDPQLAEAWATLATVESVLPGYMKIPRADHMDKAVGYAQRALALDPDQVVARLTLANIQFNQGMHQEALEQFNALTEEHPRHSQTRLWYSIALYKLGHITSAFGQISIAVELDPVHATMLDWFARIALTLGRHQLVAEPAERALQLGRQQGQVPLMQSYFTEGEFSDFEPYAGDNEQVREGFRWAFEVRDNPDLLPEAMAWAERFEREGKNPMYFVLFYLIATDSSDRLFEHIDHIYAADDTVDVIPWIPAAKHHRNSDAMKAWARSRGYESLWRNLGRWPDLCRPVSDDDWACD